MKSGRARRRCWSLARWLSVAVLLAGCEWRPTSERLPMPLGGEPRRAAAAIRKYGCNTCHRIPGIRGAAGHVGPPLDELGLRLYLAGRLRNTPENLVRWIRTPQSIEPGTVMPNLGVTDRDARDIAAYLFTLR